MNSDTKPNHEPALIRPKYRPDIDGLRAIAVLSVVGFHVFPHWVRGGFIGVDIFFVISGYLISSIIFENLEKDNFSYKTFYARRIKRIFPALSLALWASVVVGWFVLLSGEYKQLGKHVTAGAAFVSNFVLWKEAGYFDSSAISKPLLHLWSLAIEEQFYIFWPLLLGVVWKRKHSFLTITVAIALFSFAANIYMVRDHAVAAFYSPLSRFWELMMGGVLAYLKLHGAQFITRKTDLQAAMGLMLVLFGLLLIDKNKAFPGWWALAPTLGTFLCISAGPQALTNKRLLANKVLVWFGLISYPLYLWHWLMLSFVNQEKDITGGLGALIIATCIALAWLTYRFVETPIRSGGKIKTIVSLCVAVGVIGCIGQSLGKLDGLKYRPVTARLQYDWENGLRYKQCFVDATDSNSGSSAFADDCIGKSGKGGMTPLVFLWGDSHAASLYRGIENHANGFDVAQYTASGCPPILDFQVDDRKQCKEINSFIFNKIKELKPNTVVLAAYWSMYNGEIGKWNKLDYDKLEQTIGWLKALNIPKIYLVGHLPTFNISQPQVASKRFVPGKVDRTFFRFNEASRTTNEEIRQFAKRSSVDFVSPIDLLCNRDGCLISTSRTDLSPLSWDYGHLTVAGATLLFDLALKEKVISFPEPPDG